ncbi:surface exclusion protein ExcA [Escherichia coli]|nr:surface exclusion protein ExcA [Escherichia coli]
MKDKKETPDRFPTWWLLYYVLRKAYFFFRNTFLFILRTDIYTDVI